MMRGSQPQFLDKYPYLDRTKVPGPSTTMHHVTSEWPMEEQDCGREWHFATISRLLRATEYRTVHFATISTSQSHRLSLWMYKQRTYV